MTEGRERRAIALPPAVLLDLDGTLYVGARPIPGAVEAVARLRAAGIPLRAVTNSTRRSRGQLAAKLRAMGFAFEAEEVFNAPAAAAAWLRERRMRRVVALVARGAREEFAGFELDGARADAGEPAEAVVVGDMGDELSFAALNRGFRALHGGAALVACQKNRYWQEEEGLTLDAGPLVAALEYAAGVVAAVVGKPDPEFFRMALRSVPGPAPGASPPPGVLMVGDDLDADVGGAQAAGLHGVLVRTGKFRPADLDGSPVKPDLQLDSIASLPEALGL